MSVLGALGALGALAAFTVGCGGPAEGVPAGADGAVQAGDGGCAGADAVTLPDGRVVGGPYVSRVVSFTQGENGGFGADRLPDVVMGPPVGGGDFRGGTDVLSLGVAGEVVLGFDTVAIADGEGTDFVVFENPFEVMGCTPLQYYEELGEVAVSDDGVTWHTFPCDPHGARPHTGCAGWNPVYSAPGNGLCATDVRVAGGDPFDLRTVGVTRARYVRIRDLRTQYPVSPTAGFDLDAIAVIHGTSPL